MQIQDPQYIDPSNWICQGPKVAPVFQIDKNVSLTVKRDDVTGNSAVGRGGVKYIRNQDTDDQNRFRWFETKDVAGGTSGAEYPGEELSVQTWIDAANTYPLFGIEINEFMEGGRRLRTDSAHYRAWENTGARKYEQAGRQRVNFMCYGNFDMPSARDWKIEGVYKGPLDQAFRNNYANQQAARNLMASYFAQHYANCWPSIKYYPERPYTQLDYYQMVYAIEVVSLAMNSSDRWGFVTAPLIESLPGSVLNDQGDTHINIETARRVANPPGIVYTTPHPQYDYDLYKALALSTVDRCTDLFLWDTQTTYGTDPNTIYKPIGPLEGGDSIASRWVPDVAGTPAPYAANGRGFSPERLNFYDKTYEALHYYNEMKATQGVPFQYLSYSSNGGAFTNLQGDRSDILFHANAKRGVLRGRIKNGIVSKYYYNPVLGKHQTETITDIVGAKTFTYQNLKGQTVYAWNESIS